MRETVVAIFPSAAQAKAACRALCDGGFPIRNVSIIARHLHEDELLHDFVRPVDVARYSATGGAFLGGVVGLMIGAALLWVPGFGPLIVVGSIGAALLGGAEGALVGAATTGLLGWLIGFGVSHEMIQKYEQEVQAGKYLVIAHGDAGPVAQALEILSACGPEQLDTHAAASDVAEARPS